MDVETVETLGQRLAPGLGPEHAAAAVEHPDLALQAAVPRPVAPAHGQHAVEQLRARRRPQVGSLCTGDALARENRDRKSGADGKGVAVSGDTGDSRSKK